MCERARDTYQSSTVLSCICIQHAVSGRLRTGHTYMCAVDLVPGGCQHCSWWLCWLALRAAFRFARSVWFHSAATVLPAPVITGVCFVMDGAQAAASLACVACNVSSVPTQLSAALAQVLLMLKSARLCMFSAVQAVHAGVSRMSAFSCLQSRLQICRSAGTARSSASLCWAAELCVVLAGTANKLCEIMYVQERDAACEDARPFGAVAGSSTACIASGLLSSVLSL
jgi:hypothetical protein